jgi:catechol 2,3-dioxygenase-like lactoylglutathione lyase family enzyme
MKLVKRLSRITLNSSEPEALARFFIEALGFSRILAPVAHQSNQIELTLGSTRLNLIDVGQRARPYPDDVPAWSPLFQHCAIAITDMTKAIARLERHGPVKAISTAGPQQLPPASGGVIAYKFRDPEGHPLELIYFPDGCKASDPTWLRQLPRIDHSAISVADTNRSVEFYSGIGLTVGASTLNRGAEQEKLDGLKDATVEVTTLDLPRKPLPHVELLSYRGAFAAKLRSPRLNDIAATRLVFIVADLDALEKIRVEHSDRLLPVEFSGGDKSRLLLRDPDGHILQFELGLAKSVDDAIGHPQRVCNDGQGGIHRADRWKEARIGHI